MRKKVAQGVTSRVGQKLNFSSKNSEKVVFGTQFRKMAEPNKILVFEYESAESATSNSMILEKNHLIVLEKYVKKIENFRKNRKT